MIGCLQDDLGSPLDRLVPIFQRICLPRKQATRPARSRVTIRPTFSQCVVCSRATREPTVEAPACIAEHGEPSTSNHAQLQINGISPWDLTPEQIANVSKEQLDKLKAFVQEEKTRRIQLAQGTAGRHELPSSYRNWPSQTLSTTASSDTSLGYLEETSRRHRILPEQRRGRGPSTAYLSKNTRVEASKPSAPSNFVSANTTTPTLTGSPALTQKNARSS